LIRKPSTNGQNMSAAFRVGLSNGRIKLHEHSGAQRHFFDVFFGTFPPSLLASLKPMAIACLRLVTFLPDRPLLSLPCLRSFIALWTFSPAFFPYLAMSAPQLKIVSRPQISQPLF